MNPDGPAGERWMRWVDGRLPGDEAARAAAALAGDAEARRFVRAMAEQAVMIADVEREAAARAPAPLPSASRRFAWRPAAAVLAGLAACAFLLAGGGFFRAVHRRDNFATITALDGSVQWTGDGGRVVRDLVVGSTIAGGTIEGIEPLSWFELRFGDGTTVAIVGNAALTFSDLGQKRLHLGAGTVSADVRPQPAGRPLVVQTTSAALEVHAARLSAETGTCATRVDVVSGGVGVRRLSDGAVLEVPARHRAIVAADRDFSVVPVLDPVAGWTSRLAAGPEHAYGRWLPGGAGRGAVLEAIPFTSNRGVTLYVAATGVSTWDDPPVLLRPGGAVRVRGRLSAESPVHFGVTVRDGGGAFAGRFHVVRGAGVFEAGKEFDVTLPLREFVLDPVLKDLTGRFQANPAGLAVESVWCHTLTRPAGLELHEVSVLPPPDPGP